MSGEVDVDIDDIDAGEEPAELPEAPADSAEAEGRGTPSGLEDGQADAAQQPVKRRRGRPKKTNSTPYIPSGPKRKPGRPSNAELLERFANSHRQPEPGAGATPPAQQGSSSGSGGRRGRGRERGRGRGDSNGRPPSAQLSRLRRTSTADEQPSIGRATRASRLRGASESSSDNSVEPSPLADDSNGSSEPGEDAEEDSDASEPLLLADGTSDADAGIDADAEGQEEEDDDRAETDAMEDAAAEVAAEVAVAAKDKADTMPAEISLERPGMTYPVIVPTAALGDAISAYMIIRAFSWQLRLSPVAFEEFAAALFAGHPSPLIDEMMVCILRALAEDENRAQRAEHALDLALLDAVTWPDYLWDYLRLVYNPLGRLSAPSAASSGSTDAEPAATRGPKHHMHALGQGIKKYDSEEAAPTDAKALLPKASFPRRRCREFYSLPAESKGAIMHAMAGYLLDVRSVRREVDRREACGQWVAGSSGEGGAFAMRTPEEKARRAAAGSDDEGDPVEIGVERDGNTDMCCLCNQGGSLLCCDRCPASYHMRCIGEQAKSLPEGEWACPECAVGGRGEAGGLRVPRAGLDPARRPCWLVQSAVFCSARPQLCGSRSAAEEADEAVPMVRLRGADALEKAAFLKPIRREEKYLKSSLQALHDPAPQEKRALTSAEGYLNRYRNGWATSAAAVKAWVDEMVRRRGKPLGGQAPVPLNEMPVPVPISRFLWPFGQGKGARPTEKCGVCLHCTRPALRKGCLNPIVRSENPDESYDLAAKLQTLINYALKAERDLWGLLDGPWDGPNYADHRRTWSTQVRSATRVEQVAACMLQLEASLRRGALSRDWDPLARLAARQATASRAASEALPPVAVPPPAPPAPGEVHPSTPQADASAPGTPNTLAVETGTGRSTRERRKVDYKEPSLIDMPAGTPGVTVDKARALAPKQMDDLTEYDFKSDSRVVENEATKKAAHWVVNNKSLWARFNGRYHLPQALAKKAARQSGRRPIPGLVYSQKLPGIAQRQRWAADVEAAVTCPELAVALRHFDAAVLWDSVRRPAEEGKWAGVQFLGRRPGLVPASWQYLIIGGPAHLQLAKEPQTGADTHKSAERLESRGEIGQKGLGSPFAAAHQQSVLAAPLQPISTPQQAAVAPPALAPPTQNSVASSQPNDAMQNGAATSQPTGALQNGVAQPQANHAVQPSLLPEVLRKLLIANGLPASAAAHGVGSGGVVRAAAINNGPVSTPVNPIWMRLAQAVIAATVPLQHLNGPSSGPQIRPAGGLAGLLPQASQLQSQLQAGAGRPAFGWYQQPRQAPQGPSARWVAEADLPLWLVRGQEERARREAAMAAAEAQQKAARETREAARSSSAAVVASELCALCGGGEGEDQDSLWVECDTCTRWYHGSCVGASQEELDALGDAQWECPECQISRRAKQEKRQQRRQVPQEKKLEAGVRVRSRAAAHSSAPKAAEEPEYKKVYKPRKPRAERTIEEQREIEEEDAAAAQELFCVCQQPDDPEAPRDFVQCDKCQQWFHPECVNTTTQAVHDMEMWACPLCTRRRGGLRTAALRSAPAKFDPEAAADTRTPQEEGLPREADLPRSARGRHADVDASAALPTTGLKLRLPASTQAGGSSEQQGLPATWCRTAVSAMVQIMQQPEALLFTAPVSDADAPGYSGMVSRPMDLGTIKGRLQRKKYQHPADVYADIRQVWTNCRLYNAEGSDISRACKRLEKHALAAWKEHELPRKHGSTGRAEGGTNVSGVKAEPAGGGSPLPAWGGARRGKRATQAYEAEPAPRGVPAEQAQAALKVLKNLMRQRFAAPFLEPVPEQAAPGYYAIIKQPRDLTGILHGLESEAYPSLGAVLADVGLLWQNCRTFNAEGSDIAAMADEAEVHFVQLWAKKELPFESADVPGGGSEPQKHATLQTPPEDEGKHSKKRGRAEDASPAVEGTTVEDATPQNKRSRTGRVIVPPATLEEALTSAPAVHPGRVNRRGPAGAGIADATPEEASQPTEGQQKGRRKGRKSVRRVEWPPAPAEQLAAAQKVVKAAAKGESGWVFAVPVTDDVAPGYSREIRNPMDLGAIAKKLKSGAYHTLGAVLADVALVWANCRQYNEPTSELLPLCTAAEADFLQRWQGARLPTEPEVPVEDAALEPSSPAEQGPMQGAVRRRFKADLLAIAAAADAGPEAASPEEDYGLPLSSKERRRQKPGARAGADSGHQEHVQLSAGAPLHASNEGDMHASAVSAEAALEQSRPPKKRRHISINLPAAHDKAANPSATPQGNGAAGHPPDDPHAGGDADENIGGRGSRRKQGLSQEADPGRRMSTYSNDGSLQEQIAEAQGPHAPSPGLKVKLKRHKL